MKIFKIICSVFLSFFIFGGIISICTPGGFNFISVFLLCVLILLDIYIIKSIKQKEKTIVDTESITLNKPASKNSIIVHNDNKKHEFATLNIQYNSSNPQKIYTVNADETKFFECLFLKISKDNLQLIRMSDGTLSVEYGTYPIGRIKLQGRKHYMFIFKNIYDYTEIEGTIDDFIQHQDEWVNYLKKHVLKELK